MSTCSFLQKPIVEDELVRGFCRATSRLAGFIAPPGPGEESKSREPVKLFREQYGDTLEPTCASRVLFRTNSESVLAREARAYRRRETMASMTLYRDRIYPRLVSSVGNPKPIRALRRSLVPLAAGTVLEIGVGAGANLPFYEPDRVRLLYALEPNPGMRRLAATERRQVGLNVEFIDLPGERLPLEDASVDTVVSTFTLCTIANLTDALRGIKRVLKPGGQVLFLELTVASDPRVRRWQRLWEPIHRRLFEGLYLTRDIPQILQQAGFQLQEVTSVWLTPFPRSWAHCCKGTAIARGEAT